MQKISVIIPTYNRSHLIHLTLNSFLKQSYPDKLYEIIVCDNNSTDSTREVVKKIENDNPGRIRYIFEPRQGVHYARNTAAKESTADILYFTDDDMLADTNLLMEIVVPFNFDEKVASVTGRVLPNWEETPPEWIVDLCSNALLSLNDPQEDFIISRNDCNVFSCHQAIKREVFFESGGFNPENTAGEWVGDGETGLNIKIKKNGYKFGFNGRSIIHHIIPQSRMTQSYLNGRLANQGNCDSYTMYREEVFSNLQLLKQISKNIMLFFVVLLISIGMFSVGKNKYRLWFSRSFYFVRRVKYDCRLFYSSEWRAFVMKNDWLSE